MQFEWLARRFDPSCIISSGQMMFTYFVIIQAPIRKIELKKKCKLFSIQFLHRPIWTGPVGYYTKSIRENGLANDPPCNNRPI